ncbi:hypothetical protein JCM18882A_34300 [Brevibacterium metallidurans]|uniref:Glycosyltransferase sugar-binding region containing DXD motif-containing protein n=2 Tax=Brevibacterium metallidurans TaxID=1482676 RepID=A0ABP3CC97_9MICO
MERALGDNFTLVSSRNLAEVLGDDVPHKHWRFTSLGSAEKIEVRSIVAKSDYLRMKLVGDKGGYWIDADTLVFRDFTSVLDRELHKGKLLWHSEQLFGAEAKNEILLTAAENMFTQEYQTWGNPGGIKDLVESNPDMIAKIDFNMIATKSSPEYGFSNQEVVLDRQMPVSDFLANPDQRILKLYNTALSDSSISDVSVEEFLDSSTLLAKIFLSVEDRKFWVERSKAFVESHF